MTDPSPDTAPCPEEELTDSQPTPPAVRTEEEFPRVEEHSIGGPGTEAPAIDEATALRPVYPLTCRRLHHDGTVVLRILVGTEGIPLEAEVTESAGCKELDQAARAAVLSARFKPARSLGQAITASVVLPIRFELRDGRR